MVAFRDWISHAICTKIEGAPGNRFLLEQLLKAVHTPYGGIFGILNDKMASMLKLMQGYLCAESHHREILLPWHFWSPFAVLHIHHAVHLGAMCMTSGFCSSMICIAFCWPDLVFRSKPVRRSTGAPTRRPVSAALWLNLADPERSSRKFIEPFETLCQRAFAKLADPSWTGSSASSAGRGISMSPSRS